MIAKWRELLLINSLIAVKVNLMYFQSHIGATVSSESFTATELLLLLFRVQERLCKFWVALTSLHGDNFQWKVKQSCIQVHQCFKLIQSNRSKFQVNWPFLNPPAPPGNVYEHFQWNMLMSNTLTSKNCRNWTNSYQSNKVLFEIDKERYLGFNETKQLLKVSTSNKCNLVRNPVDL